jgi:predicted Zn-dependent protease
LLLKQFSRDFEREADMLAVTYLADAGIDPSGLYDFFAKLKEKEAETTFGAVLDTLSILSTHPANSERKESRRFA